MKYLCQKFYFLFALCSICFIASCSPKLMKVVNPKQMKMVNIESPIIYNKNDIKSVIDSVKNNITKRPDYKATVSSDTILKKYVNYPPNKAMAVGYPAECGTYRYWYNFSTKEKAVEKAMGSCLDSVRDIQPFTTKKCGCKLVAVNKTVLVPPVELIDRKFIPIVIVLSEKGKKPQKQLFALGRAEAWKLTITSREKEILCKGTFRQNKLHGNFDLLCFDSKVQFKGDYKIKGFFSHSPYGVGKASNDDVEAKFIFGMTEDEYKQISGEVF